MKVYVVYEYAVIEYEECIRNMGVFSSIEKAEAAIKEYDEIAEAYKEDFEYNYEAFELDTVWESIGDDKEDDE
jgi:ABC-type Fe3+-hydroxamate transport system substrate-binding protein